MDVRIGLPIVLAMAGAVFVYVRRQTDRSGYNAWFKHWKKIDRGRRRRILRAIRRGDAVDDPRDAPLALEAIEHQQMLNARIFAGRGWKWFDRVTDLWMIGTIVALALVARNLVVVMLLALLELFVLSTRLFGRRAEVRIKASREKNERLRDSLD